MRFRLAFAAMTMFLVHSTPAQEAPPPKPGSQREFPVKMKVLAEKSDASGKQVIAVHLTIKDEHEIFANPVGNDDLRSLQTFVRLTAKKEPRKVTIHYPKGEIVKDILGDFGVYRGRIRIEVIVERAAGDGEPLDLAVRLMPMSHKRGVCLWLPTQLKETVKP